MRNTEDIGKQPQGWLRLDNAAKLYPAIISDELSSVFRITARLREPVKIASLSKALEIAEPRFPYYNVSLGAGVFWYYLEPSSGKPRLLTEEKKPCTAFPLGRKDEVPYRILARKNRISVEFNHIIADGSGALEFLKTLLWVYFDISGRKDISSERVMLPDSAINPEESEDAFNRHFRRLPAPAKLARAWHLPFKSRPGIRIITAHLNASKVHDLTKSLNISVTEYFTAVYLYCLEQIYIDSAAKNRRGKNSVLRLEVPVNLRRKLPSVSMRNFSLFVLPELEMKLGEYSFDDILRYVHHYMQTATDTRQIARFLSQNVSHEKNPVIRLLPLFIKSFVISRVYKGMGSRRFTGVLTNLGVVSLPEGMEKYVSSVEIIPPPPNPNVKVVCGMASYKGILSVCFANITVTRELERRFFRFLTLSGLEVKLLSTS